VAAGQGAQRGAEFGIEVHFEGGAGRVLHRRAGPVGGQLQQRRGAAQVIQPEVQLGLQPLFVEAAALPDGVVGVLDRQRRQRCRGACESGTVQGGQFAHEHRQRPAVEDHVMQGQQ
jgi:hypothetical protein